MNTTGELWWFHRFYLGRKDQSTWFYQLVWHFKGIAHRSFNLRLVIQYWKNHKVFCCLKPFIASALKTSLSLSGILTTGKFNKFLKNSFHFKCDSVNVPKQWENSLFVEKLFLSDCTTDSLEFSLNRDESTESRENKKNSTKMLPALASEPRTSDFTALHATIWADPPICWQSQPFRSLCSHALLIPKYFLFAKINRAWIYKDLKVCDFQQIGELAQIVACRAVKSETLGSLPSG